jgi:type I restriction enzyme, S subunit
MKWKRYPKYKDSGVQWLGEVPDHWAVAALNYRYEIALGKMLDGRQIVGDQLAPYLRNVDVQWDRVNTADLPQMDFSAADRSRFSLRAGDLLVCEGGEVGRAAVWVGQLSECYYQKAVHRLRSRRMTQDEGRFMLYSLWDSASKERFTGSEGRSTIAHLTAEAFRRYLFAFPPKIEQTQVVLHLDRETAKIDTLIAKQERLIELLQEKRQALISHAVTKGLNPDAPMKPSGVAGRFTYGLSGQCRSGPATDLHSSG